jgi:hypothetical protein
VKVIQSIANVCPVVKRRKHKDFSHSPLRLTVEQEITMTSLETIATSQPTAIPNLTWISGKITQILLQDKELFYLVGVNDGNQTHLARFGDPYTGKSTTLSTNNPMYSLIEKAFFHNQSISLGVRDFGFDPQSGIERIIIDRVSVSH